MKKLFCYTFLLVTLLSWKTHSIELEKRSIFNNKIELLMPTEFVIMDELMLKLKYPSGQRPTLVYTNEPGTINLAFNHTTSAATQEQLAAYKETFVAAFKSAHPNAQWKGSGIEEINGKKLAWLSLVTQAIDTKIYNLIFFTDFDGRLLLCNFNCTIKHMKEWLEPAQKMMHSFIVKN